MLSYAIRIEPDDNDTFLVTCKALPEVTTFGENRASAKLRAVAAIEEAIAARIADGQDIPAPTPAKGSVTITLPAMTALKVQLYNDLRGKQMTRADLVRALKWNCELVDRLFRIDHASKLDQIEAAFWAIGERLDIRVEHA